MGALDRLVSIKDRCWGAAQQSDCCRATVTVSYTDSTHKASHMLFRVHQPYTHNGQNGKAIGYVCLCLGHVTNDHVIRRLEESRFFQPGTYRSSQVYVEAIGSSITGVTGYQLIGRNGNQLFVLHPVKTLADKPKATAQAAMWREDQILTYAYTQPYGQLTTPYSYVSGQWMIDNARTGGTNIITTPAVSVQTQAAPVRLTGMSQAGMPAAERNEQEFDLTLEEIRQAMRRR